MGESTHTLTRRKSLQALAGVAAASFAGCMEDASGDVEGLGERIPDPIIIDYYGDAGITAFQEACAPVLTENLEELLGVKVNVQPVAAGTLVDNAINDKRESHFSHFMSTMEPDRLDPDEMTRRWAIDWAGGNGRANLNNYANCKYSELAVQQASAGGEDQRREIINEAHSIFSEDVAVIPTLPDVLTGAYNSETVDIAGLGETGLHNATPHPFIKSEPTEGDRITTNGTSALLAFRNYIKQTGGPHIARLGSYIHSGLAEYDENLELDGVLADDWEIIDDFRRIEVDLVDAEFSNEDPITADDVQFTFEHIWGNVSTYPYANPPDDYAIEVIDDQSLVFEFENPQPGMESEFSRWGIYHSEAWIEAGAEEDPNGFEAPLISSGPFEVSEWTGDEFLALDPRDNHPVHDPDHGLDYLAYSEQSAVVEAFMAGELDIIVDISHGTIKRIKEEFDAGETVVNNSMFPHYLAPHYPMSPCKFREFRAAVGACLDRSLMNELAAGGDLDPELALHSAVLIGEHPWRPPEDQLYQMTDDPLGDMDAARKLLEEAGWGWDGDDVLRYPEDADTAELWPEGEEPSPDDFGCLEDYGEIGI